MDLREIGWDGVDWSDVGPVEDSCEYCNDPWSSIKCWEVLE
jgi:hypothetical protein